jgi:hypothetical protein
MLKPNIMKSKIKFRAAILIAFFFCMCELSAQLPSNYPITNATTCNIRIKYRYLNSSCVPLSTMPINATVPFSGLTLFPPATAFDIEITAVWVNMPTCPTIQANPAVTGVCPGNTFEPLSNSGFGCSCTVSGLNVTSTGAAIN